MVSNLGFQCFLCRTLLINCLVVYALSAPYSAFIRTDPLGYGSFVHLFTLSQGTHVRGSVRDHPTLVDYNLQNYCMSLDGFCTHCQFIWVWCFNTIILLDLWSSSKWSAMGYSSDWSIILSIKWLPSELSLYDLRVKYVILNEIMCFLYLHVVLGFVFSLLFALIKVWVSFYWSPLHWYFAPSWKEK